MLSGLTMTNTSSIKQVLVSGFESPQSFVQFFIVPAPSLSLATAEKIGYSYCRSAQNAFD